MCCLVAVHGNGHCVNPVYGSFKSRSYGSRIYGILSKIRAHVYSRQNHVYFRAFFPAQLNSKSGTVRRSSFRAPGFVGKWNVLLLYRNFPSQGYGLALCALLSVRGADKDSAFFGCSLCQSAKPRRVYSIVIYKQKIHQSPITFPMESYMTRSALSS